jgi:hypothetical protein
VIFICFLPWRSIFLLMNVSNMLLSCCLGDRDTCSTRLGWTNISYTMKSASPFKGSVLKNGILGTQCVPSVSTIKIVPLINGYCKLIFLSTFTHTQIIHTQRWQSISHTLYQVTGTPFLTWHFLYVFNTTAWEQTVYTEPNIIFFIINKNLELFKIHTVLSHLH